MVKPLVLWFGILANLQFSLALASNPVEDDSGLQCSEILGSKITAEIASYQSIVDNITKTVLSGSFKHLIWNELATFTDTFGSRFEGTTVLEDAIDYMLNLTQSYGLENVHGEDAMVPHWVRGNEYAVLTQPRRKQLSMLGLGYSVGTPKEGIHAKVLVVESFDELKIKATEAVDRIVVIAEPWLGSYEKTVEYRTEAAVRVAKVGGLAALIRSLTPFSMNNPHTGITEYAENVTKIPTAALTAEDAQMLLRMSKRGEALKMSLFMEAKLLDDIKSRNTVAELIGKEEPEKVVIVSGHLDSWDVGQGAMDDGGGAFISWGALALLKTMNLRSRRTIRAVLWTAEEMGRVGAKAYADTHKHEQDNFIAMMESDEGTFTPYGLAYSGPKKGSCIVQEILKLMKGINATEFESNDDVGSGTDIEVWLKKVPLMMNLNRNERYFWFHHSDGDTMAVVDPEDLDKNLILWTATAYVLADISVELPKPNSQTSATKEF